MSEKCQSTKSLARGSPTASHGSPGVKIVDSGAGSALFLKIEVVVNLIQDRSFL